MKEKGAVGWAVLAAALYAVSTPVSKLLLREVAPAMLAALLYLGAGIGMLGMGMARGRRAVCGADAGWTGGICLTPPAWWCWISQPPSA